MIFGVGAVLSQILKISPWLASDSAWNLNFSHIVASIVGIILFLIGKGTAVQKIVYYSLFSGRERMKRFIFFLPITVTLFILVILKSILGYDNPSYERIMGEGGFVEYGTTIAYVLAFAFSIPIGKFFIRQGSKKLGFFYYLLAIFFILVALEEISWGQTFFNWETPSVFQGHNVQQETSLHNLVWFHYNLRDAIIVISFLIGFSALFFSFIKLNYRLKQFIKYLLPDWFLASFFLTTLGVSILLKFQNYLIFFVPKDQEFAELVLALGFFFFVLINYFRQALRSLSN
jgi:hypothetical protein